MSFKINPLDSQIEYIDKNIPRHPFSLQICGSKGSGKTTTLLNMIYNKHIFYKKFDSLIWISPTIYNDDKVMELMNKDVLINKNKKYILGDNNVEKNLPVFHTQIDEDFVTEIVDKQNELVQTNGKKDCKLLLIFDDCLGTRILKSKKLLNLIIASRPLNISIIYLLQAYKTIPKTIRLNNSGLLLFELNNSKELRDIYDENTVSLDYPQWLQIFKYATANPFDFLFINYQNKKKFKMLRNFEEYIVFSD